MNESLNNFNMFVLRILEKKKSDAFLMFINDVNFRPPINRGGKIIMCCGFFFPTKHSTLTPVDMQWRDSS